MRSGYGLSLDNARTPRMSSTPHLDLALHARVAANRRALHERIRSTGHSFWTDFANRQPIVPVEAYLAEGVTEAALANPRLARFGVRRLRDLLLGIRDRPGVSDVAFEVSSDLAEDWPDLDTLYVATLYDRDEVAAWFEAIPPDLILRAGDGGPWVRARVIRIEDLVIAPGHHLWALRWNPDA